MTGLAHYRRMLLRRFAQILLIALSALSLSSCLDVVFEDTPEKVMDDKLECIDDFTQMLVDISEGKLSTPEIRSQMLDFEADSKDIKRREKELICTLSIQDRNALQGKYQPELDKRKTAFFDAIYKLQRSRHTNAEVREIVTNFLNRRLNFHTR